MKDVSKQIFVFLESCTIRIIQNAKHFLDFQYINVKGSIRPAHFSVQKKAMTFDLGLKETS